MDFLELPPSDSDSQDSESEQDTEEEEEEEAATTLVNRGSLINRPNSVNSRLPSNETSNIVEIANDVVVEGSSSQRKNSAVIEIKDDIVEDNKELEWNREVDGSCCPICFESWSSGGDHHVCCLPCGHIYGLSCIKKWLRRRGSSKCPQCKKKCALKDIRLLYATQIVAVDGELQKKVQSLEAECVSLQKKNDDWSKKEVQWKKKEADLCKKVRYLEERTHTLKDLLEDTERRASGSYASSRNFQGESAFGLDATSKFHVQGSSNKFIMQEDFQVDGARLFDIDPSSHIFIIARRLEGMGGMHVLTKMSMLGNNEIEDIQLPLNTKAVRDLRISPHAKLVLLASLGKKLSVLSTESNNTILNYDLPVPAWSCSWDICSSHYVYAGLQNGKLLQFDLRNTMRHVESLSGLTGDLIHTVQSLSTDSSLSSSSRSVLTASSVGVCQWNFGRGEEKPNLISESDNQGVCISLAYCPASDDIVASYRPKIGTSPNLEASQPALTSVPSANSQGVCGSHVLHKKEGSRYQKLGATCAFVSSTRLPKSVIIEGVSENPMFVSANEGTPELALHELPSLMVAEHLKPQKFPIHDIKYSRILSSSSGLLGCLSKDSLQLFRAKLC